MPRRHNVYRAARDCGQPQLPGDVLITVGPLCNDTVYRGVGCEVACVKDTSITQYISCKSDGTWDLAFAACPQVATTLAPQAATGQLTTSTVVGLVCGILVGVALIVFIVFFLLRRRGKSDISSGGDNRKIMSRSRLDGGSFGGARGGRKATSRSSLAPANGIGAPPSNQLGMSANPLHRQNNAGGRNSNYA